MSRVNDAEFIGLDTPIDSLPCVVPSPFRQDAPHPLAQRAAEDMQASLSRRVDDRAVRGSLGGKMFGVLVAEREGRVGYFMAHAGTLDGRRGGRGFVGPLFDEDSFDELWARDGGIIEKLDYAIARLPPGSPKRSELLAQQRAHSAALLPSLQALYRVPNARGEQCGLAELFDPRPIPGGAGDCAAPKLLAHAYAVGARPLALAEFWWGSPTPAGGRHHGAFYPACRGRCGTLLPFMLRGLRVEAPPDYVNLPVPPEAPRGVFEDSSLLVVDKPCGLLSVPGRGARRRDSVQSRLQARSGLEDATWPRLVHRLDQATSGLLIAAKQKSAYVAIQQQFSRRTIVKRYVAVVRGILNESEGLIDLPLRPDFDDRPRQMHDPDHGRPAVTRWRRLAREGTLTRVEFFPQTGRSHQLRLHAAHPLGLGAPIVGDALYGWGGGPRLMLHAQRLDFVHPVTGSRQTFEAPVPF